MAGVQTCEIFFFFFFKQKTAYEIYQCDWSSDVCSSDLVDLCTFADKTDVVIGGIITNSRQVVLRNGRKQGEKMGILTIEDLKGKVEVTLSPKELDKYRGVVKPDAIVFIRGTVSRRREEPSVRANEVIAADQAPAELSTCLVLGIHEGFDSEEMLEQLLAVCRRHHGSHPLYLEIQTTDDRIVIVKCDATLSVTCSPACLRELADVAGARRIICPGPKRRPIPWENAECKMMNAK